MELHILLWLGMQRGGRSNFAGWNGPNRFVMTAVLEEYDDEEK